MDTFPTHYFSPEGQRPYLTGRTISSGQSVSGLQQQAKTDGGGLWVAEMTNVALNTSERLKLWRSWVARLDGGATQVIVPLCDLRQAPVPIVDGKPFYGTDGVPHSDGTFFSDGTGYGETLIAATSVGAVGLRGVVMTINISVGGDLSAGMHFSVVHATKGKRLYRVATITSDDDAGTYGVTIRPPMREAIAAGTPLDFEDPGCVMTVVNSDAMEPTVKNHKFATADVTFIEAF
jgi:hypothetical protein